MLQADPKTFFSIMVTGKRSIGKTAYSLHAAKDFFVERGSDETSAWLLALDCLKFSMDDVIDFLDDARKKDIKKPIIIWDDLRVHASGSQYRMDQRRVARLASLMDFIRTCVSNVVMTCPSSSGLLGVFKSYDDYFAKIHYSERGGYYRVALGYAWSTIPSGKRLVYSKFRDNYSCYIPTWIYRKYDAARKAAFDDLMKEIKSKEFEKE